MSDTAGASTGEITILSTYLVWSLVSIGIGLVGVGIAFFAFRRRTTPEPVGPTGSGQPDRRHRITMLAAIVLLVGETTFLILNGAGTWRSTSTPFASTPAVAALKRTVGSALVGFGSGCVIPPRLGIVADANVAYNVRELYLYDPIIPEAYFHAWYIQTGNQAGYPNPLGVLPLYQDRSHGPPLRRRLRPRVPDDARPDRECPGGQDR